MQLASDITQSCSRPRLQRLLLLLLLLAAGCALLVMTRIQQLGLPDGLSGLTDGLSGLTGGRHRGRPISGLWAPSRPEQAWFTSTECRPLVTRFTRDHCLPLVYLASFPRSGNTWTRYLLETSTGLFTGSESINASVSGFKLSEDDLWKAARSKGQLVKLGYKGDKVTKVQGITIVTKTHSQPEPWNRTEGDNAKSVLSAFPDGAPRRAVLIIRDPFKSFISVMKYTEAQSVLNDDDMIELFNGTKWTNFVAFYTRVWYNLNVAWIESTDETHVLSYERLTRDTIGELRNLLRFLDIEPDRRRMECVARQLEGKVHLHRHGVVPDHQTFPVRLRVELWSHIHLLNMLLKDRGHQPLPLKQYSFADEFADIHGEV